MKQIELEVKNRNEVGTTKVKSIRLKGSVPAVVYGKDMKTISIEVDYKKFQKIIRSESGKNALITLKVTDGTKAQNIPVLTHEIQRNPLDDNIIHIDFHKINMEEKIKTKVKVDLIGTSIGVKEDGGILVHGLREVEVKCLPGDIPGHYKVDVTELKINNGLHVSDIKTEKGVEITTNKEEMIVTISAPTKEEEPETPVVEEGAVPAEGAEGVPVEEGKGEAAPKAEDAKAKPEAKKPEAKEKK